MELRPARQEDLRVAEDDVAELSVPLLLTSLFVHTQLLELNEMLDKHRSILQESCSVQPFLPRCSCPLRAIVGKYQLVKLPNSNELL